MQIRIVDGVPVFDDDDIVVKKKIAKSAGELLDEYRIFGDRERSKEVFVICDERKLNGFEVWMNEMFPCRGGRKITKLGLESEHSARKVVEDIILNKKGDYKKYDEVWVRQEHPELSEADYMNLPECDTTEVEMFVPHFDPKLHHKHILFLWYIGAAKSGWNTMRLAKTLCQYLQRKFSRRYVMEFHQLTVRLQKAAQVNLAMQQVLIDKLGSPKFPQLEGTLKIPGSANYGINENAVYRGQQFKFKEE